MGALNLKKEMVAPPLLLSTLGTISFGTDILAVQDETKCEVVDIYRFSYSDEGGSTFYYGTSIIFSILVCPPGDSLEDFLFHAIMAT